MICLDFTDLAHAWREPSPIGIISIHGANHGEETLWQVAHCILSIQAVLGSIFIFASGTMTFPDISGHVATASSSITLLNQFLGAVKKSSGWFWQIERTMKFRDIFRKRFEAIHLV